MNGFTVKLSSWDCPLGEKLLVPRMKDQSMFMTLFNDVLDIFGDLYWFFHEAPITTAYAVDEKEIDYFFSDLVPEFEKFVICPPHSLFPKYARWIKDDNVALYGFKVKPEQNLLDVEIDDDFILKNVDVLLLNEDAYFWACFAKDEVLLKKCILSVRKVVDDSSISLLEYPLVRRIYQ